MEVTRDPFAPIREKDGTLPYFAWPGGYQILYTASDGETVCPKCANGGDFRVADGEDDSPRDGFRLEGYFILEDTEGDMETCCHCNATFSRE